MGDQPLVRVALHPPLEGQLQLGSTIAGTLDLRASHEAAGAGTGAPNCVQVSHAQGGPQQALIEGASCQPGQRAKAKHVRHADAAKPKGCAQSSMALLFDIGLSLAAKADIKDGQDAGNHVRPSQPATSPDQKGLANVMQNQCNCLEESGSCSHGAQPSLTTTISV